MAYTTLFDEDKKALQNNTAAIRVKLIVKATDTLEEIILTDDNSIKELTYTDDRYIPETGFIGQFVARTLEGELQDISDDFNIEDREIELQIGIVRLGSRFIYLQTEDGEVIVTEDGNYILADELDEDITTWYTMGTFIVSKPEDDEVSDNTSFESLDKTTLFNQSFDTGYTDDTFTKSFKDTITDNETFTALQLAQYTCAQVGVELGNTDFINNDFEITTNQFTDDYSCRDIMKAIAQLAFGYCKIGWDDKCYIDVLDTSKENIDEYSTLDNNQYFSLTTQKNNYGPINKVVMGLEAVDDIEGGSTSAFIQDDESIIKNGTNEIDIYDNIITYTQELRQKAITKGSILYGIEFVPLETETIGHFYLPSNKLCKIVDMEGNVKYTYPFNMEMTYSGHIRTTIDSTVETQVARTMSYSRKIYKDIKSLKIELDRQEGIISIVNSNISELNDGLESLETKVEQTYTDTYTKTEIQEIVNGIGVDGTVVTSVKSTAGTFDKDGLTIEQSEANTATNINANGMIIYDKTSSTDEALLSVTSDGVVGKNVKVSTYLTVGSHSRLEDYSDSSTGDIGTGVFWIGDD
jgi:hypothetical protein